MHVIASAGAKTLMMNKKFSKVQLSVSSELKVRTGFGKQVDLREKVELSETFG